MEFSITKIELDENIHVHCDCGKCGKHISEIRDFLARLSDPDPNADAVKSTEISEMVQKVNDLADPIIKSLTNNMSKKKKLQSYVENMDSHETALDAMKQLYNTHRDLITNQSAIIASKSGDTYVVKSGDKNLLLQDYSEATGDASVALTHLEFLCSKIMDIRSYVKSADVVVSYLNMKKTRSKRIIPKTALNIKGSANRFLIHLPEALPIRTLNLHCDAGMLLIYLPSSVSTVMYMNIIGADNVMISHHGNSPCNLVIRHAYNISITLVGKYDLVTVKPHIMSAKATIMGANIKRIVAEDPLHDTAHVAIGTGYQQFTTRY